MMIGFSCSGMVLVVDAWCRLVGSPQRAVDWKAAGLRSPRNEYRMWKSYNERRSIIFSASAEVSENGVPADVYRGGDVAIER